MANSGAVGERTCLSCDLNLDPLCSILYPAGVEKASNVVPEITMAHSIESPRFEVVVSIINFRTAGLTIQCVQSVLGDFSGVNGHVVIVDNLSDDGSAEEIEDWITAQGPDMPVSLVRSATNSGFSGGHNQGMAAREADFYLVLNSDAELRPGFLKAMLATVRSNPDYGFFTPRLEDPDGTAQISHFRFPTPLTELIRTAETGFVTRLFQGHVVHLTTEPEPDQIGWASFACILLRSKMVEDLGPMDEGYFLYFEDAEYCWRARQADWRILHVPEARAIHYRGGSGPVKKLAAAKKRMPAYFYASRARLLYQLYGWGGLMTTNLLWYLGRMIGYLRVFAGKPVPKVCEREASDIWINAFSPLGDRRASR